MAQYKTTIAWQRRNFDFSYKTYDRTYTITFDSGRQIEASSPPEYLGKENLPNPEELLISALAGCYMLTFLAVACKQGFIVEHYTDEASGITGKNAQGRNCITEITLRPRLKFSSSHQPDPETLNQMRNKAHEHCFISNSVNAQLTIDIQLSE